MCWWCGAARPRSTTFDPAGGRPFAERDRRDDPVQLDLDLDAAVQAQVPAERVLVVADGRHRVDDEPPPATRLDVPGRVVGVLPQQPRVLLVQADRVGDPPRRAGMVGQVGVEVGDLAEAVAPELERVQARAEPVLAGVEVRAPVVHRVGLAVGDDHLRARSAVEDRPAVVAEVVQDEPLLGVDGGHEGPAVPPDLAAVDAERHALGLGERERAQVLAGWHDPGAVVAVGVRDRAALAVLDLEDAVGVEVDIGDEVLDRAGVGVVVRIAAQVGHGAAEAVAGLERMAEDPAGQDVDLHEAEVVDAPRAQRGPHALVLEHAGRGGLVVLGRDRRPRPLDRAPGAHVAVRESDDDLLDPALAGEDDERLARRSRAVAVAPREVVGLGRLPARRADDPGAGDGGERRARRAGELVGVERGEGMGRRDASHRRAVSRDGRARQWAVTRRCIGASEPAPRANALAGRQRRLRLAQRPLRATRARERP